MAEHAYLRPPSDREQRGQRLRSFAAGAVSLAVAASLVGFIASPAHAAGVDEISIASSKVLDLKFDGNLTDSSSNAAAVSMQKGTAAYATGVHGQAFNFGGANAVNLGTAAYLQPADLTLSFWFKPNAAMGSAEQVFTWSKTTYNSDGWYLSSESGTRPLALSIGSSTGQPYKVSVDATRADFFPTTSWTHVVVTYNKSTKAVQFYRNGVRQTASVTQAISATATGVLGSESTSVKTIGYNGPTYNGGHTNGLIDDYKLYNGVATTADVVDLTKENNASFDPATVAASDLAAVTVASPVTANFTLPTVGATGSAISWSSSNPSLVSVAGGSATVTRPVGGSAPSATLTATANYGGGTSTKTFAVEVTPIPIDSVTVSRAGSGSLAIGGTEQLSAVVAPTGASQSVVWSTSSSSVATVSSTGLVTATGSGNVTITATSVADGTKVGTIGLGVAVAVVAGVTPTISGVAKDGSTLTVSTGTWNPADVTFAYQWKRAGAAISGATASTYVLTSADVGSTITVTVTGSKSGYTPDSKTSAATGTVAANSVGSISIASSKVLELKFNGDLTDSSTKAATISMQKGTAAYGTGVNGQAFNFGGANALNLGTAAYLQPTDLTLSFWYKPNADMGSAEQVFAWSKTTFNSDGWYLSSQSATVPLALSIGASTGQPYKVAVNSARADFFPTTSWTHVVVTYDHVSKQVSFYRNGVKQASSVANAISTESTGVLGSEGTSVKTMGYNGPTYNGSHVNGLVDDYRLYNGVATTTDVVKLTQENAPTFDPATVAASDLAAITVASPAAANFTVPTTGSGGSTISWSSSNPALVSVTGGSATVTRPVGGSAPSATLTATATYGGSTSTKTFVVAVTPVPISGVAVTRAGSDSLIVGSTEQLSAVVAPTGASQSVTWSTSNSSVATVASTGLVTIVGAGSVTITATSTVDTSMAGTVSLTGELPTVVGSAPTISGTTKVGSTLTAVPGEWGPSQVELSYQWNRDGVAIDGATAGSYGLVAGDAGKTITVKVTGSKAGHNAVSHTSAATAAISDGDLMPGAVTLSGEPRFGATLTANIAAWAPGTVSLSLQWLRNGTPIAGATSASYTLGEQDNGATIAVRVSGSAAGYTAAAVTSASTAPVAAGILSAPTPKLSGNAKVGKKLTVKAGTWKPAGVTVSYQWYRSGKAIKSANKASYKIVKADKGKKISVKVTGMKAGYTTVVKASKVTKKVR